MSGGETKFSCTGQFAPGLLFVELDERTVELVPKIRDEFPRLAATTFPEIEAFRRACLNAGLVVESDRLARERVWRRGLEHEVWKESSDWVLKATYDAAFGVLPWGGNASPLQYLNRLRLCDIVFGDRIELVGICEAAMLNGPPNYRVVTRQPFVIGEEVPQSEIDEYLSSLGFTREAFSGKTVWISDVGNNRIVIGDLHPKNVLRTPLGKIVVIDGIVAGVPHGR